VSEDEFGTKCRTVDQVAVTTTAMGTNPYRRRFFKSMDSRAVNRVTTALDRSPG
jgi:hypothetical protein